MSSQVQPGVESPAASGLIVWNHLWYQQTKKKFRVNFSIFSHSVQGITSQIMKKKKTLLILNSHFYQWCYSASILELKTLCFWFFILFSCVPLSINGKLYWINRISSWCFSSASSPFSLLPSSALFKTYKNCFIFLMFQSWKRARVLSSSTTYFVLEFSLQRSHQVQHNHSRRTQYFLNHSPFSLQRISFHVKHMCAYNIFEKKMSL